MSKKRGMWMGGTIPIGYDSEDGKLTINKAEAEIVRFIFNSFIETASTTKVVRELRKRGYQTKGRISRRGNVTPPRDFTKTSLYKILNNKVYIGQIEHKAKKETYEGKHDAIIDMRTWNEAQCILNSNKMNKVNFSKAERPYLLRGLIRGPDG